MTRKKPLRQTLTIIAGVAMLAVACGSSAEPSGDALDHIAGRSENISRVRGYESVQDLVTQIESLHESEDLNAMVAIGTVSAVNSGSSFRWDTTTNGGRRVELPYGDSEAMIDTVHLTFDVVETLAPHAEKRATQFTVGLAVGPELEIDKVRADYLALGQVVMFLKESAVFDYQPGIYGIFEDGQMMGLIDDKQNVTFPILEPGLVDESGIALDRLRPVVD